MTKYKDFKVSDIFDVVGTKSLDEGKLKFIEDGINFVGRVNDNNGVKGKIQKQSFEPNEKKTITCTVIGNYKYVKYQKEPYYCSQNINKLIPKFEINELRAIFIITHLQKFVSQYDGMQSGYKLDDLKNHIISLPVNENGKMDFEFMEKYISELEEERISELATYLKVSGLDNYELSNEEKDFLINKHGKVNYKQFYIKDFFNIVNTHSILSSSIVPNSGKYPYVTASQKNNSISTYVDYDLNQIEKGNCIFIGGKTLVITYQPEDFFSNDSHNLALYVKKEDHCSENVMLYLVTALYKSLKPIYSWGDSISKTKIQKDVFYLPINNNGNVDYEYMNKYISIEKKVAIADVVKWKDKMIMTTKKVVLG